MLTFLYLLVILMTPPSTADIRALESAGVILERDPETQEIYDGELPVGKGGDAELRVLATIPTLYVLTIRSQGPSGLGLSCFREHKELTKVDLLGPHVCGDAIKGACSLKQLTSLFLNDSPATDADLVELSNLAQLEILDLAGTKITDATLRHFKNLIKLELLNLQGTNVTDEGLKHLSECKSLQSVVFSRTKITNAGLKHLIALPKLRVLVFDGCAITNDGLRQVGQCRELEQLDISNTPVTREGLRHLLANKKLEHFTYENTALSKRDEVWLMSQLRKPDE